MPEHRLLPDSELHQPKGAATASAGHIMKANGDGTTSFVHPQTLPNVKFIDALTAASYVAQNPSAVDTPIQITYGPAQVTPYINLSSIGAITILQSGVYDIFHFLQFSRPTGAGTSRLLHRLKVNGVPFSIVNGCILSEANTSIPSIARFTMKLNAGDIVTNELMRDSSGSNDGGLTPIVSTLPDWGDSPSAYISFDKLEGVEIE